MKNPVDIKRGYQLWYMIRTQLVCALICIFVQFVALLDLYSHNIFRNIAGFVFAAASFISVFDGAATLAKFDNKPYTPLEYNVKYSVLWGGVLAAINAVLILAFIANWHFGNPVSAVYNLIFYVLEAPYFAFMIMSSEHIPTLVAVAAIVLPLVASVLGYISGKNEFTVANKIRGLMFEKEKNDI